MSKNTIIVTGGLGYIGSHTVVELLNSDYEVVIIDNCSNSNENVIQRIQQITNKSIDFYNIDLRDYEKLYSTIGYYQESASAIIHFAACKSVGESMNNPQKYYDNNVNGTFNLLKCMKKHNINNLIFSSSCTVYGQADELPITEQTPIKPAESVYGRTKQICENMISDFHAEFDFNSILLRYFNPIGAHETGLIGESPNGIPDNLIPYVTQTAIGIRKELIVFGTDYDTKDGTCVRDYIHVVDLAKAHVCAITATNNKKYIAEPINLGTGNGYTVKEVLNAFEEYNDVILNIKFGERRSGDVTSAFANADYAYSELNWKAELGLKEMVKSAWLWEKNLKKKCCNNCKCSK